MSDSFIRTQKNFQVRSQKPVMSGTTLGHELVFDGQVRGNTATKRVQFFFTGNMSYRLLWTGPAQQESLPEVEHFLQSFRVSTPTGAPAFR